MATLNASLQNHSMTDELTGLCNRRAFSVLSRPFLDLAHGQGKGVFVVFVDLDGLKRINDESGHGKGDEALKRTAEILTMTFRKSDIIARLGGDEFAVVTVDHGRESAARLLARLQMNNKRRNGQPQDGAPLSLSVGVAHSDPQDTSSIEELTTRADNLMYIEKRRKQRTPPTATNPELVRFAA